MAKRIKTGGRPKGAVNKRTREFLEVLEDHNFCAASAMIEVFQEAKKVYDSYAVIYEAICKAKADAQGYASPVEDKAHIYLKIAGDMAKEISSYSYPKRKAIDMSINPAIVEHIKQYESKSTDELLDILNNLNHEKNKP